MNFFVFTIIIVTTFAQHVGEVGRIGGGGAVPQHYHYAKLDLLSIVINVYIYIYFDRYAHGCREKSSRNDPGEILNDARYVIGNNDCSLPP